MLFILLSLFANLLHLNDQQISLICKVMINVQGLYPSIRECANGNVDSCQLAQQGVDLQQIKNAIQYLFDVNDRKLGSTAEKQSQEMKSVNTPLLVNLLAMLRNPSLMPKHLGGESTGAHLKKRENSEDEAEEADEESGTNPDEVPTGHPDGLRRRRELFKSIRKAQISKSVGRGIQGLPRQTTTLLNVPQHVKGAHRLHFSGHKAMFTHFRKWMDDPALLITLFVSFFVLVGSLGLITVGSIKWKSIEHQAKVATQIRLQHCNYYFECDDTVNLPTKEEYQYEKSVPHCYITTCIYSKYGCTPISSPSCYWDETFTGIRTIQYVDDVDGEVLRDALKQEILAKLCVVKNKGDYTGADAPSKCNELDATARHIASTKKPWLAAIIPGAIIGFFSLMTLIWSIGAMTHPSEHLPF
eukprot:NODE_174_length_14184_cov_0.583671.p3 type:complete len:414 gc:universal NODE_174_length_14184_cov_0.583671:3886-2645(-)